MIEAGPRLRSVEYDVAQITAGMTGPLGGTARDAEGFVPAQFDAPATIDSM